MMLFDKPAKISVRAVSDVVLLQPNHKGVATGENGDETAGGSSGHHRNDTLLEGQVVLSLPTARRIKELHVELIGRQNILVKGVYHTYDTIRRCVEVETGNEIWGPGDHTFAFSFVVPADTAPYERSAFGRTYHKLVATATGLGKFGADLVATDNIALISNHSETGGVPPGFSLQSESHNHVLGPIGVNLSSKYLLVSGYLRLDLVLPSIAAPVRLVDVQVQLLQTFRLQSPKDQKVQEEIKPKPLVLWSMKEKEALGEFAPNQFLNINRQFRLPDDDKIRPTTSENSQTGIRVSHRLAVVVHFQPLQNNPTNELKELRIATDATISSCCCMFEVLQLPAYSLCQEVQNLDRNAIGYCSECLCKIAESKKNVEMYGVPPEELTEALNSFGGQAPFPARNSSKDEDEFGRELIDLQAARTPQRAPSPPPGYWAEESARLAT